MLLAAHGYATAVVNPIKDVDTTNKKVSYTLFIDPGKKIYVRNINISGNNQTRDAVVRRELRQQEAAVYNGDAIKQSKNRLDVLGFFKSTNITTTPSLETNDQVDLDVKVEEADTGSIQLGLGYAPASGIMGNINWSKTNLFGSGKSVALNANANTLDQAISFSFTDPYFLSNGTSLGYDLSASQNTPNNAGISDYSLIIYRAGVRSSVPVSDYDRINFQLALENNQITINNNNAPSRFIQFVDQYGTSVNEIPFTISWLRNTIDSYQWPTTGAKYKQAFTISVPAIGPQYYKFHSTNDWYFPISKNFTWKTTGIIGLINSYGNNNTAPFYQNFFVGGPDSLRGFYPGSLGAKDPSDDSSLGATRWFFLSNNLLFPVPGFKNDKIARIGLFYDLGSAFGGGNTPTLSFDQTIRGSAGVALNWFSPLGAMTISYGYPMFTQPGDKIQNVQFTFGTTF